MKKIIRVCLLIVLSLIAGLPAFAQQQNAEEKKRINQIKKSEQYLYAEVTTEDKQNAIDLADEALDVEINKYVANEKKFRNASQYVARNTSSTWERITLKRGTNMYRAFVYVKKSDIFPAENVRSAKNPQTAKIDNITFNSLGGNIEVERATKLSRPTKTEVAKTQSAIDELPDATKSAGANTISISRYDQVVERLKTLSKSADIVPLVKRMKTEGLISDYNTYKNLADPSEYLLIVYNKGGAIEALLSDGVERINLKTGNHDNVGNYKGRGALGVKVKK